MNVGARCFFNVYLFTEAGAREDAQIRNYRMIAALAVLRKEIARSEIDRFVFERGMPGFSPTQGHIPAAVPFLGHAIDSIKRGEINNAMFLAKGSLFLGRMSQLSDGLSFLIEKNPQKAMNRNPRKGEGCTWISRERE